MLSASTSAIPASDDSIRLSTSTVVVNDAPLPKVITQKMRLLSHLGEPLVEWSSAPRMFYSNDTLALEAETLYHGLHIWNDSSVVSDTTCVYQLEYALVTDRREFDLRRQDIVVRKLNTPLGNPSELKIYPSSSIQAWTAPMVEIADTMHTQDHKVIRYRLISPEAVSRVALRLKDSQTKAHHISVWATRTSFVQGHASMETNMVAQAVTRKTDGFCVLNISKPLSAQIFEIRLDTDVNNIQEVFLMK